MPVSRQQGSEGVVGLHCASFELTKELVCEVWNDSCLLFIRESIDFDGAVVGFCRENGARLFECQSREESFYMVPVEEDTISSSK